MDKLSHLEAAIHNLLKNSGFSEFQTVRDAERYSLQVVFLTEEPHTFIIKLVSLVRDISPEYNLIKRKESNVDGLSHYELWV
jgi:hypothetical protein